VRIPSADWIFTYMRAIGLIAAGMIIGSACFMAVYQHNFSLLYMENQQLKTDNEDMRKTLEPYLKNKTNLSVIRQIKLNVFASPGTPELDEIIIIQLKKKLAGDLEAIRGRPLDSAAETLLVAKKIVERKVYTIDLDQEFTMELGLILIKSADLTIWAEVRPYIRSD